MSTATDLTVSVVVVTYGRPDSVRECLRHLARLDTPALEVVVVDSTPDDRTRRLVREEFPDVRLLHSTLGRGTTPESRQMGFAVARGDVVAFVDDDAYVAPDWLDELLAPYADPDVVAVGGRADNGIPGEERAGLDRIGRLLPDGRLTGYFAADPGRPVEVDHLLGANMSFRREALAAIGGIRGNYPGPCLCEESDISLRLRAIGGRLVYAPRALVRHMAAPYGTGGRRFDLRYLYYARRNHVVMLVRNFGWRDPMVRRYARTTLRAQTDYLWAVRSRLGPTMASGSPRPLGRRVTAPVILSRAAAELSGLVAGVPAAVTAVRRDRLAGVARA
ncbi:glycosyltransferase family 2 protein [Cellulosimicrobium cellulans]|uniref:glycosyltransferase family 2 protein n=1 Tax=Cellulosimicrobium cellulans TaxID=1710 RepID=UPI000848C637|nr:glycosyltransferase family 2 protein [Cellulosimicrobium cellulans]